MFRFIIADESHYLKSKDAKRTATILPLLQAAAHTLLLSGTPALNQPRELYTQVNAVRPRLLGTYEEFAMRYCAGRKERWGLDDKGSSNLEELHNLLTSSVMIRRLKRDVLATLPPKRRRLIQMQVTAAAAKELAKLHAVLEEQRRSLARASSAGERLALSERMRGTLASIYRTTGIGKLPAIVKTVLALVEPYEGAGGAAAPPMPVAAAKGKGARKRGTKAAVGRGGGGKRARRDGEVDTGGGSGAGWEPPDMATASPLEQVYSDEEDVAAGGGDGRGRGGADSDSSDSTDGEGAGGGAKAALPASQRSREAVSRLYALAGDPAAAAGSEGDGGDGDAGSEGGGGAGFLPARHSAVGRKRARTASHGASEARSGWACPHCELVNLVRPGRVSQTCASCGVPRPDDAVEVVDDEAVPGPAAAEANGGAGTGAVDDAPIVIIDDAPGGAAAGAGTKEGTAGLPPAPDPAAAAQPLPRVGKLLVFAHHSEVLDFLASALSEHHPPIRFVR